MNQLIGAAILVVGLFLVLRQQNESTPSVLSPQIHVPQPVQPASGSGVVTQTPEDGFEVNVKTTPGEPAKISTKRQKRQVTVEAAPETPIGGSSKFLTKSFRKTGGLKDLIFRV